MALRRLLSKRMFDLNRGATSPHTKPDRPPVLPATLSSRSAKLHREYLTSPESAQNGFFRRAIKQLPGFLSVPAGDKLRETLKTINSNIAADVPMLPPVKAPVAGEELGLTVGDARKLLRVAQVERIKARVREIPESAIPYNEFVKVCVDECGGNVHQGLEFSKLLDRAGNVVILGRIVFLHPQQVAKSMESIISRTMVSANDPRREQLEVLEKQKAVIDQKARALVRGELYCGLGFLVAQTLGFMRLTFWELSWDVMEPICFFVTSLHFALAYGFFLRTSTEPSFEGYFRRRFRSKQEKLMRVHNFDLEKYNELRKLFYPNVGHGFQPYKFGEYEEGVRTSALK